MAYLWLPASPPRSRRIITPDSICLFTLVRTLSVPLCCTAFAFSLSPKERDVASCGNMSYGSASTFLTNQLQMPSLAVHVRTTSPQPSSAARAHRPPLPLSPCVRTCARPQEADAIDKTFETVRTCAALRASVAFCALRPPD